MGHLEQRNVVDMLPHNLLPFKTRIQMSNIFTVVTFFTIVVARLGRQTTKQPNMSLNQRMRERVWMNSPDKLLDLRVRRTYKLLWEALIALMGTQEFETMTVTDICEHAMVHRTTFYKHYEDKYGLLYHGMHDELNALIASLKLPVNPPVGETTATNGVGHLVVMFEHILTRERFYRVMLGGNGIDKFYTLWRKSLASDLETLFQNQLQWTARQSSILPALRAHLHAGALVSVVAWWLENNFPCTPAELAHDVWQEVFS
jgi:AcrR family transcriptional regulator